MEENNKKKKKKLPLIITCIVAVFVIAFVGLCVSGTLPIPTENGVISLDTALLIKNADDVQDEETLRALLLLDQELEITVTKDIEISDTLEVVNTKTLKGDAEISYNITGLFAQGSIMEVQKNAHLIMDGLVLSGEGMADAITVKQRAELTYKSGTIQYVRYGISTNGKVTIDDATIQHTATAAIFANFRSDVVVNKGYFYNSYSTTLQIENGGSMEIYEGVVIEQSGGTAINNIGDLLVYGCTIKDTVGSGINNEGNMTIEYKGSKADGMIEMENIGKIALRIASSDNTSIKDVHVNGTGTNGVFVTDLVTKGSLTLSDCVFENTGDESGNTFSIAGNATIKDVTIKGSQKGSFYVRAGAKVKVSDLTIENCSGNAMSISGELIADGITINGATGHGIDISKGSDKEIAKATLSNIHISGVAKNNLLVRVGCSMEVKDTVLEKSTRTSVYVSNEGNLTLENVEVQGVVDEWLWCVAVAEGANVTLKGDSFITGGTRGGVVVEKNATFTMESGKISGINGIGDGAAVYLRGEGTVFNFVGGTLSENITEKAGGAVYVGDKATFNMKGGVISGNKSTNRGGGVYVLGTMNFTGGTISGNESETSANGILCKGKVIVSGNAYMGKDDIGVDSAETPVIVKGSTLKKHSAKEPLLITAQRDTKPGTVIANCDSNNAAVALVTNHVASGTKAYSLYQLENGLAVSVNKADMDMTGADTVYVSTFAEFKKAVESTKTKRYIVVGADIAFESEVFVPLGVTVYVRDDGTTRTLSRKDDMGSNLISTSYGTGLYLVGTSAGKLVIDGATSASKDADKIDPAVRVYGGTEIKNMTFKNNLTSEKGAFVRQDYGDIAVYSSTFTGGKSTDHGGALYFETGSAIVENCVFENNNATKEGGAIRAQNNTDLVLTIKTSEFNNNTAGTHGGAISSGAGTVAVTSSNFTNNTAKTGHAGAISAVNAKSVVISGAGTLKGNSAVDGGAVYTNNSIFSMNGYTFDSNIAETGGAITINNGTNNGSDPVSISDVVFTNNTATDKGGAIYNAGRTTNVTNCTFNSNTSKGHGGATYIAGGGTMNFKGSDTAKAVFASNTAGSNGGAVYVAKNGTLTTDGYAFNDNSAAAGGAINATNDSKTLTVSNAEFVGNKASGQGGAIRADGDENTVTVVTIKDATFNDHTAAASGGAIYTKAETHIENASFTNNSGTVGGAINACGGRELAVTNCTFTGNKATRTTSEGGGAVIITAGTTATFDGTGSFTSNDTGYYGGAIFVKDSELSVEGYTFTGNTALATATADGKTTNVGRGGAIYTTSATVTVKESKFESNSSVERGGAIFSAGGGTLTLEGTDASKANFSGNTSTGHNGGAVAIGSGVFNSTGYTFDGNTAKSGGAIAFNNEANITSTLKTTVFKNNQATSGDGGAFYISCVKADCKAVTVEDCKFETNTAANGEGGAIYTEGATPITLTGTSADALFTGNSAKTGGAIYKNTGVTEVDEQEVDNSKAMSVTGYIFDGNSATTDNGGAIFISSASENSIINATFTNNASTYRGGAIYNNKSTLTITDTKFEANNSPNRGGAIYGAGGGTVTLNGTDATKAIFSGNNSGDNGGAYCIGSGTLTVTGYTFSGNTAKNGGAISFNNDASIKPSFTNCVFTGNTATAVGGAIHCNIANTSTNEFVVKDSKFDGNIAGTQGGAIWTAGGIKLKLENVEGDSVAAIFQSNTITSTTSNAYGGAIYVSKGTVEVIGYSFNGNTVSASGKDEEEVAYLGRGGAIYNVDGNVIISNSVFEANTSTDRGGAICNTSTKTLEIVDTSFKNSKGDQAGAILQDASGDLIIKADKYPEKAVFEGNSGWNGGAIRTSGSGSKITITGYKFISNTATNNGGALCVDTGTELAVINCTFGEEGKGNSAGNAGGAIYFTGSAKTGKIENSSFVGNSAKTGGAIHDNGTDSNKITGSAFTGNTSTSDGGAVYNKSAAMEITNPDNVATATFTSNVSSAWGGAIYTNDGTFTLSGYTLSGNKGTYGGAILMFSASTVSNTTFTNNEATSNEGGAIYNNKTSSFTNCTFSGNKAATNGGAILTNGGKITVIGSTFKANTVSNQGGAIYQTGATGSQITDTVFGGTAAADGNVAGARGGAVYNGGSGTMTITGTDANKAVFAYNSSATGGAIGNGSGTITVSGYAFKNNTALDSGMKRGGAIYVSGGTVTLNGTKGANEVFEGNDAPNGKIAYVSGGSLIINNYSLPGTDTTYFKKDSGKTIKIDGVSL